MLTSKSTKGCRLTAGARAQIRPVSRTGVTSGRIPPEDAYGKTRRVPKAVKLAAIKRASRKNKPRHYKTPWRAA